MFKNRQKLINKTNNNKSKKHRLSDGSSSQDTDYLRNPMPKRSTGSKKSSSGSSVKYVPYSDSSSMSSSAWGAPFVYTPPPQTTMLGGPKKKSKMSSGNGPNAQPIRTRKLGKKGQKKSRPQEKEVVKQVVQETKYKSFKEEIADLIEASKIQKEVENEFPNLQAIRVECTPNIDVIGKAASVYSLYAMSKRAWSPKDVIAVSPNQDVGLLWLAWYAIMYDLYFNATANRKSMFSTAHPHYRRFFNSLRFNTTGGYSYTWVAPSIDTWNLYWTNRGGPVSVTGLSWESGVDNPVTGRRVLVNSFPSLQPETLQTVGATAAAKIFQACLAKGMKMSQMEKLPQYQQNFPPAAFAFFVPDDNPEYPFSGEIRCEVPIDGSARDIAELGVCLRDDPERSCPYKEGVITGFSAFFLKLTDPTYTRRAIRVLPKEIPITSIITALLSSIVTGSKLVMDDLSAHNLHMSPDNILADITSGQLWTIALLQAAQRFSIGNIAIGLEPLAPSGSYPLAFDARAYVPLTTYNNAFPTGVQEALAEFSIHEATSNSMAIMNHRGVEIYLPFVSARGQKFGGNPIMTADTASFNDFVSLMFPHADVQNWAFATLSNPAIPNYCDVSLAEDMYFVGATPADAINQINAMFNILAGGLSMTSHTDVNLDTSIMYFTQILSAEQESTWDRTQYLAVTRVSNRFPLNSQIISTLPNLTPVFYGGSDSTAAGYLAWYSEYSTLLGESLTMRDMLIRWFRMYGHQRAAVGSWIPNDYYVYRGAQGKGGGFFNGIIGMVKNGLRAVGKMGNGVNRVLSMLDDDKSAAKLNYVINNPHEFPSGPYQALDIQNTIGF